MATTRAVSIPVVCDAQKGLLVPVSIQGAPPRLFVLDTGSSITVIDDHSAAQFGLAPAGEDSLLIRLRPARHRATQVGTVALPRATCHRRSTPERSQAARQHRWDPRKRRPASHGPNHDRQCQVSADRRRPRWRKPEVHVPLSWHQGRPVIAAGGGCAPGTRLGRDTVTRSATAAAAAPCAGAADWHPSSGSTAGRSNTQLERQVMGGRTLVQAIDPDDRCLICRSSCSPAAAGRPLNTVTVRRPSRVTAAHPRRPRSPGRP